MLKDNVN